MLRSGTKTITRRNHHNISHLAEGNALGLKLGDVDGAAVGNGVGSVVGSGVTGRFVGLPDLTDGIGEGFVLGVRVEGVLDGCIRAKSRRLRNGKG